MTISNNLLRIFEEFKSNNSWRWRRNFFFDVPNFEWDDESRVVLKMSKFQKRMKHFLIKQIQSSNTDAMELL
jgi:hypothetical protein